MSLTVSFRKYICISRRKHVYKETKSRSINPYVEVYVIILKLITLFFWTCDVSRKNFLLLFSFFIFIFSSRACNYILTFIDFRILNHQISNIFFRLSHRVEIGRETTGNFRCGTTARWISGIRTDASSRAEIAVQNKRRGNGNRSSSVL